MKVKISNHFQMLILVDLQVRHAKPFHMRVMNTRLLDEVGSLLFDFTSPVAVDPTPPMILFIAVRQWTSGKSESSATDLDSLSYLLLEAVIAISLRLLNRRCTKQ